MHLAGAVKQLRAAEAGAAGGLGQPRGVVVTYWPARPGHARSHEGVTCAAIGRALAGLKGCAFAGEYDAANPYAGRLYFVPGETLVGVEAACELGVRTEDDLFGGVVPFAFVATKAMTHPLVEPGAAAPDGWSHGLARRVCDVVLPGLTAFTPPDARRAGARLLELGPVRVKPARGSGWRGQSVVAGQAALDTALGALDVAELTRHGVVLEQNLAGVTTCSVGQVRVGGVLATYYGTQRATTDNGGAAVYGGSDLVVVRGDYDVLLGFDLAPEARLAVAQAREFDAAAAQEFPGLFASRRNYDVAQGTDAAGRWRSGVLEQSWRVGGASGAEVAALEALRVSPALRAVRARCVEEFGPCEGPPPQAIVYFRGVDDCVGPITKYAVVEPYVTLR